MSETCKTLIDNFLNGSLLASDLEHSFGSIFSATPSSYLDASNYLHTLYSSNRISPEKFSQISQLISQVNIDATLSSSTDVSAFDLDQTQVFENSFSEPSLDDKTVIIRMQDNDPAQALSKNTTLSPEIIDKPHQTKQYDNIGTTLKGRFQLQEKLGQGGMGVVFKAKDLLKVEAQDKNPYVAIKVLTDAFKQYSGSFIALQREASKAQRLAHPNIATVYDFDRDGDTVFMTMEYLQGKPMNQLIKELPGHPLTLDLALHMIDELCSGLAYAHEKNLIHSDFKPGNCFVTSEDQVKLLDFGIARASTETSEDRDETAFDIGKLCAVTPAYATVEMFAGMSPDPRDDIYGLACVAYQLLSGGRHPYNKMASTKIKELGIKPKAIKGLNRKQQKTLLKGLAIERKDRIETVAQFAAGLRPKKSHVKHIILATLFITVIGLGFGYKPMQNFFAQQQLQDKIQLIKQGDKALLIETIWSLKRLESEQQQYISVGLRREIITYYRDRIQAVFKPQEGLYNYPQAANLLTQAKQHYPDSVALSTIEDQIKEQKDRLIGNLTILYNRYIQSRQLARSDSEEGLNTVVTRMQKVDPKHYLITSKVLAEIYLDEAEKAFDNRQFDSASTHIEVGLTLFPEDTRLQTLKKRISSQDLTQ